jgi:pyruvate dehydrogenase E1 component alpha subunit
MSQPYSEELLLRAYRRMSTIRQFEDRLLEEVGRGSVPGFTHLYAGQEAIAVGVCENLTDADAIVSTHRGHGHCIAKGCDVKAMMQEIFGKAGGLCGGKGGSMHIADFTKGMLGANGIVGGGPPIAVGAAFANKYLGNGEVTVSFGGDGSSNQGTVFEAMNMAVVLDVPTIFVFENNGFSEKTGADYAVGSKDVAGRAAAFGMPAMKGDGTDFFTVYETTKEMVERARRGEGPSALEFTAPRYGGHFVGDPETYRAKDEVPNLRRNQNCLANFRQRVTSEGWLEGSALDRIDEEVAKLVAEAVEEASKAPPPSLESLHADVYASPY